MNYLLLIIPITLIIINMPVLKNKIYIHQNRPNLNIEKIDKCRLTKLRGDTCLKEKLNNCPMSSYKQCSNNVLPINKCECKERSFELCELKNQYGEKCALNNFKIQHINSEIYYPKFYPRVNMYRTQKTRYDRI